MRKIANYTGIRQRTYASDTSSNDDLESDLKECTCHHCGYYMNEPIMYNYFYYEKEHLSKRKNKILPKGIYLEDLNL